VPLHSSSNHGWLGTLSALSTVISYAISRCLSSFFAF
jgi:hypothetical protein